MGKKLYYYHGIAVNNGDGTWRCRDCGFTAADPNDVLDGPENCTHGKPACSYCGGTKECELDCPGVAKALAGEDVYIAGSLGPTEHKT